MEKRLNGIKTFARVEAQEGGKEDGQGVSGDGRNFARKIEATAAGETRVSSRRTRGSRPPLYQFCQLSIRPSPRWAGGVNKAPFEVRDPRNPICSVGCPREKETDAERRDEEKRERERQRDGKRKRKR